MVWQIMVGLKAGSIWLPTGKGAHLLLIERTKDPPMYWVALSLYCAVGMGCAALGAWLVVQGRKSLLPGTIAKEDQ
jgi:hypothetical protein